MILADDAEPTVRAIWEKRLRSRLALASDIFERYCRVRFQVSAVDTWASDENIHDFGKSLAEFESRVRPGAGRLAIGFTGRYQWVPGESHVGGIRGPLHSHILIREALRQVSEPERLEVLVHELGHFLGAVHAPDNDSVMRPTLGDRLRLRPRLPHRLRRVQHAGDVLGRGRASQPSAFQPVSSITRQQGRVAARVRLAGQSLAQRSGGAKVSAAAGFSHSQRQRRSPVWRNAMNSAILGSRLRGGRTCLAPRGLTVVEVVAVVVVIIVLLALLLPYLQTARETARRSACLKNLARLGIGLRSYESSHGSLPPGTVDKQGPIHNVPEGYHMGWLAQLLPDIDQVAIFKQIDFSFGAYAKQNAAARAARIGLLTCPSYDGPRRNGVSEAEPGAGPKGSALLGTYTVSNYAGCHNDVEAPIDVDNHGVLFLNSHISQKDVTDGISETIYLGEKLGDAEDLGWMSGTRATLRNTGAPPNRPEIAVTPPNDLLVGGFGADHPTVCNFLFGDGRAKSLSKDIDPEVLRRLGNRSDGQSSGR